MAAQARGTDRKMRWRHRACHHRDRVTLRRLRTHDTRVVAIGRWEERDALHMVPMQVGEQDRSVERRAVEFLCEVLQAGAPVEDERRQLVIDGDGEA